MWERDASTARLLADFRGALLRAEERESAVSASTALLHGIFRAPVAEARLWAEACAASPAPSTPPPPAGWADAVGPDAAALLAEVASDLRAVAAAIRGREALATIDALRQQLARRDALVRSAGEAMIRDGAEVVRVLGELEEREAAIRGDLHHAHRFQRAMLPALPAVDGLELEALFLPAEVISGDFYDVAVLGSRVRILIADATGHGVAAGLATMFIKSEYESHKRAAATPSALLREMNEQLTDRYRNLEVRFTAICLDLYPQEHRFVYASAAHPGPGVARTSGVGFVRDANSYMGLARGIPFTDREVALDPDDLVVAFTDGLYDASGPDGELFGEARVVEVMAAARAGGPVCSPLVRAVSAFVGEGRPLDDDITVVAARFLT